MISIEGVRDEAPLPDEVLTLAARVGCEVAAVLAPLLPALPTRIVVRIGVGKRVIPGLGYRASALDRHTVGFVVAEGGADEVARCVQRHLRHAFYHECHHIARGWVKRGGFQSIHARRFIDGPISEGLASVFERDAGGFRAPWCVYPDDVAAWVDELLALAHGADYRTWMFQHPDGRRWIGYKAGTYIADCAIRRSGCSAAELATVPAGRILELAGVSA